MTTRPILTKIFGLRPVFIRLMKSLWLEQTNNRPQSQQFSPIALGTMVNQGIHRIHYGS